MVSWITLLLLLIALGFQFLPRRLSDRFAPRAPLGETVPGSFDGWVAVDEPLGATELERSEVRNVLRYSDFVFRVYRQRDVEIGIYIAYWKHGANSIVSAGGHSPDVCWVQSGWDRVGVEDEITFRLDDRQSLPAQIRSFVSGSGVKRHVVFWHVMDGCRTGYALGESANWGKRAPVILGAFAQSRLGLVQAGQYFIRIHSNRPMAEIEHQPLFAQLLRSAAACGVFGQELPATRKDS